MWRLHGAAVRNPSGLACICRLGGLQKHTTHLRLRRRAFLSTLSQGCLQSVAGVTARRRTAMTARAAAAALGPAPSDTSTIELPDGRQLAFREYGDRNGLPVIFYHGGLNSRAFMPGLSLPPSLPLPLPLSLSLSPPPPSHLLTTNWLAGWLNDRLTERRFWDKTQALTASAGVRLIALDRPGYGYSSSTLSAPGTPPTGRSSVH